MLDARRSRIRRRRRLWLMFGASAILAALTTLLVVGIRHDSPAAARRAPREAPVKPSMQAAGVRLSAAPGWSRITKPAPVPGLPFAAPVGLREDASGIRLIAGRLPVA